MKRRITLSIALVLSIGLVSLMSSDSTAKAQNQVRVVADTNMITLGQDQIIRITASPAGGNYTFAFRRIDYTQGNCIGGVCKHAISSQTTSPPILLGSGEAASFDITPMSNSSGVRGVVLSNSSKVKVTAIVFDTATQRIVTYTGTTFDDQASQ